MRLTKPKFWKTTNIISIIFYPLSLITYLINISKNFLKKEILKLKLYVLAIYLWVEQVKHL